MEVTVISNLIKSVSCVEFPSAGETQMLILIEVLTLTYHLKTR